MSSPIESAEQYTAEENEVARQAIKYLEDHDLCLTLEFEDEPSKEVKEFLAGMYDFDVALLDARDKLRDDLIEEIEAEYLAEETAA